jgi:hypothetical protein
MRSARVVVEKFMTVVGTEWNAPSGIPRSLAAALLDQKGAYDCYHVHVAPEVISLHEGPIRLLGDVAQMHEFNVPCEALGHVWYVIGRACAERTRAEGDAVCW